MLNAVGGLQSVSDSATILPFTTMTITDTDTQEMLLGITILNGKFRGDFTPSSVAGWVRAALGNNITYRRYINVQANVGATAQALLRALVFQPRTNAINPGTTELTDFQVTVSDGVAPALANTATRVRTTSINNAPQIGGASNTVAVNDNTTVNPFSTLTVTDVDQQEMLISVTILNGVNRGDFTNATSAGWTLRQVIGNNIVYKRYFGPQANVGTVVQAALRALNFRPRENVIKPGTTELTDFQVTEEARTQLIGDS